MSSCFFEIEIFWLICTIYAFSDGFRPQLTVSDDGRRILAVIGLHEFYVWEIDSAEVLFSAQQGAGLRGTWSQVTPSEGTPLPDPTIRESRVREANCDATFFISQVSIIIKRIAGR